MNQFPAWFNLDPNAQAMPQGQGPLLPPELMPQAAPAPMPQAVAPKPRLQRVAMAPNQGFPVKNEEVKFFQPIRTETTQKISQSSSEPPPQDLMNMLQGNFTDRMGSINTLQGQLDKMPNSAEGRPVSLKPLMALADSINHTNMASAYEVPKPEDSLRMKLVDRLAKEKQALADDQLKLMGALAKNDQFDESLKYKEAFLRAYRDKNDMNAENAAARMGKEKPASSTAFQAAGFAKRLQQTDDIFNGLVSQGYQGLTRADQARAYLPNEARDPKAQQFDQATRNFINATLRRESGAAIAPSEFENARAQYIPQPGDTAEVLANKAANRRQVYENFKAEGGSAFEKIPYVNPSGGKPALPKGGGMVKIMSPSGRIVQMSESEAAQALKAGGKRVE